MAPDALAFRRYLVLWAALVVIVALPLTVNYVFLMRAHELSPYASIIKDQFARQGIFGSALNGNDLKYKLELIRRVRPEVVAIGSSRAMNVRGLPFTRPFINAGGVSSNLLESETFVGEMLKFHRPTLVMYFVDYWWFNAQSEQTSNRYLIDETSLSYAKLTAPFSWLREGKISWDLYRDVLLHGRHDNPYTRVETLGVFAIEHAIGYRTDGSFFHSRGLKRHEGVLQYYWDHLASIGSGGHDRANLGLGNFVDEGSVRRYLRILDQLKQRGVQVIVVLPPVAPQYLKAIRAYSKEPYVAPLVARLREDAAPLYDFTDFRIPESIDCEFTDAYHPGDTLSMRLLKAILERTPDSPLRAYVDTAKLDDYIARFPGRTLILEPASMYKAREFDFLGLGCRKDAPGA